MADTPRIEHEHVAVTEAVEQMTREYAKMVNGPMMRAVQALLKRIGSEAKKSMRQQRARQQLAKVGSPGVRVMATTQKPRQKGVTNDG